MIIRKYPSMLSLFFIWRGSIVGDIKYKLLFFFFLSTSIVYFEVATFPINTSVFTMLGLSLSLFLSFRNNTAYNRWWEGRNIWGKLVEDLRSVARFTRSFKLDKDIQNRIDSLLISFAIALRHQCQSTRMDKDILPHLSKKDSDYILDSINPANRILSRLSYIFGTLRKEGKIDSFDHSTLEKKLDSIALSLAGCERLNNTPIPYPYALILQRTAFVYCALTPFAVAEYTGWGTPIITTMIAYTFFDYDALAQSLEDPFTTKSNGLPLHMLCVAIERVIKDMQGVPPENLPKLPPIIKYVWK